MALHVAWSIYRVSQLTWELRFDMNIFFDFRSLINDIKCIKKDFEKLIKLLSPTSFLECGLPILCMMADIKHLNILLIFNKLESGQISFNFKGEKLVAHIFEIPRLVVFGFYCDTTVKPLITNTSEEFIKCRLDNFSMSFILYYVNFSICSNK